MKKFCPQVLLYAIFFLILFSCSSENDMLLEEGISKSLADFRKTNIEKIQYNLLFDIPIDKNEAIEGQLVLTYAFKATPTDLVLDFSAPAQNIKSVEANGQKVEFEIKNGHLIVEKGVLQKENTVNISFTAGDMSLNRQDEFLYTLFVPARASSCFPLFDQPDLKAIYQLKLNIPQQWQAISNGRQVAQIDSGIFKQLEFAATKPISSYLFAFTAGAFEVIEREIEGRTMKMLHRETDQEKLAGNVEAIFDWHIKSLKWLEEYTAIDYVFDQFDFALIPSFQYGGMEHPGAIFYKASSLLLEENSTVTQQMGRGRLIAHETAHMWFGDLVTMPWFDDVWLKEVFANFMAAKIVNPQFDEVDHDLQFLMAHYPAAYAVDRSDGRHAIAQQLNNLANAGSLYGSIIYQKAPIVMRMLEDKIGEEAFQKGIREYLKTYSFGNASWDNLIDILSKHTDEDLILWNNRWVKKAGMPMYTAGFRQKDKSEFLKRIDIYTANATDESFWPQKLTLGMITDSVFSSLAVNFESKRLVTLKADSLKMPDVAFLNYDGNGYGYFRMGTESTNYFMENVSEQSEPILRGALWLSFYESMVRGSLNSNLYIEAALKALTKETEPLIIDYINNSLITTFWKFLNQQQRNEYAPKIEAVLFNAAINTPKQQLKSNYFQTYYNIATTPESINLIKKIWNEESEVEGLTLSERDYIMLAYELAIKQEAESAAILDEQIARIDNKDRKARMAWVRQALHANETERDRFFESLKLPENRENEEWVLEALRYLHHPLREKQAVKYIYPSLDLLLEIKATGDIFFPKGWLDNTLRGHQSKEAADEVRSFLYKYHDYPKDLKNKILQSADLLFRTVEAQENAENENL